LITPANSKKRMRLLLAFLIILATVSASAQRSPHYVFVLPDGYTGWIQVIFNSPGSAPLKLERNNTILEIDNSGIFRLPIMEHIFAGSHEENANSCSIKLRLCSKQWFRQLLQRRRRLERWFYRRPGDPWQSQRRNFRKLMVALRWAAGFTQKDGRADYP